MIIEAELLLGLLFLILSSRLVSMMKWSIKSPLQFKVIKCERLGPKLR